MSSADHLTPASPAPETVAAFPARLSAAGASDRAHSLLLAELCDVLAIPQPDPQTDSGYAFNYPVTEDPPDGATSQGRRPRLASRRATATLRAVPHRIAIPDSATGFGASSATPCQGRLPA